MVILLFLSPPATNDVRGELVRVSLAKSELARYLGFKKDLSGSGAPKTQAEKDAVAAAKAAAADPESGAAEDAADDDELYD